MLNHIKYMIPAWMQTSSSGYLSSHVMLWPLSGDVKCACYSNIPEEYELYQSSALICIRDLSLLCKLFVVSRNFLKPPQDTVFLFGTEDPSNVWTLKLRLLIGLNLNRKQSGLELKKVKVLMQICSIRKN